MAAIGHPAKTEDNPCAIHLRRLGDRLLRHNRELRRSIELQREANVPSVDDHMLQGISRADVFNMRKLLARYLSTFPIRSAQALLSVWRSQAALRYGYQYRLR
jgi:hypothetical protein